MDAAGGVELEGGGVIDAPVVKLIIKITSSYLDCITKGVMEGIMYVTYHKVLE